MGADGSQGNYGWVVGSHRASAGGWWGVTGAAQVGDGEL